MPKKTYSCSDVHIAYEQARELRAQNRLNLGLPTMLASEMASKGFSSSSPEAKAITSNFFLFTWAPVIGVVIAAYFWHWWGGIAGALVMLFIQKVNRDSAAQNICDAACRDRNLYYEIKHNGSWLYQMEEADAAPYAINRSS